MVGPTLDGGSWRTSPWGVSLMRGEGCGQRTLWSGGFTQLSWQVAGPSPHLARSACVLLGHLCAGVHTRSHLGSSTSSLPSPALPSPGCPALHPSRPPVQQPGLGVWGGVRLPCQAPGGLGLRGAVVRRETAAFLPGRGGRCQRWSIMQKQLAVPCGSWPLPRAPRHTTILF